MLWVTCVVPAPRQIEQDDNMFEPISGCKVGHALERRNRKRGLDEEEGGRGSQENDKSILTYETELTTSMSI